MKTINTTKKLLIALTLGAASIMLLASIWGRADDILIIINGTLFLASIVFFLFWLWDILKLTFVDPESHSATLVENTKKSDLLLLVVSIGLLGNAAYNIYVLERISEFVRTEVLYTRGIKTLAIIIGAIGIWMHRRWGAFITITILLIISFPIILNIVATSRIINPVIFSLFFAIGAFGIWFSRRWGTYITIAASLILVLPIAWNIIFYSRGHNLYLDSYFTIGYMVVIIILGFKFKYMK